MKKTWMKKPLALLLTLVMLLGMIPAAQAAESITLSAATITQSTSAINKMTVKFPTPTDIYKNDSYTYKLYVYTNSDYSTGLIGKVVSNGSKATKDFAANSTFTLTALAQTGVTVGEFDGTDFSKLPNGTTICTSSWCMTV